jgi:perosamine synthetase
VHDEIGYNYRMPNLNAALGCAQMERLPEMLVVKRAIARRYHAFCAREGWSFVREPSGTQSNYWLNAVLLGSRAERDAFLKYTNSEA